MATILVIDDEAVVREPISASLRAHGHQVTCAGDGPTAMKSLQANVPDLILLDLRMPTMDGLAVLRELRAAPATAAVPVLLLSAVTDKALVLQVAKLNIQGYILKSAFSLDELLERVRRITSPPPCRMRPTRPVRVRRRGKPRAISPLQPPRRARQEPHR